MLDEIVTEAKDLKKVIQALLDTFSSKHKIEIKFRGTATSNERFRSFNSSEISVSNKDLTLKL